MTEAEARAALATRMTDRARLLRIADRLGKVSAGSAEADEAIHQALGRAGPAPPYTTDMEAARTLLPPGFVERGDPTYMTGAVYPLAGVPG